MDSPIRLIMALFICLLLSGNRLIAQSVSEKRFSITTQPMQLLLRDLPITFERIYRRRTLGITLGYRFDSPSESNSNSMARTISQNSPGFLVPRFKGITFGVNSKYYLSKKNRTYIDAQLFYRYWWHSERFYENRYDGAQPNDQYNTSAANHVVGTKILYGASSNTAGRTKGNTLLINYYIGLGCRIKHINEVGLYRESYDYGGKGPYRPFHKRDAVFTPTVHIGFNVGVEVFRKNKTMAE